ATPTVNDVDVNHSSPWLSGTFDSTYTDKLTVTVDGKTYTLGEDSNLFQHANNTNVWVLKPQSFYHLGVHDIEVTAVNVAGTVTVTDQSVDELTIARDMFVPTVNSDQTYNTRP